MISISFYLVTDYVREDANTSFIFIAGENNETAEYFISSTFYSPEKPSDSPYKPSQYSFVEAMVAKGYFVFFYDRLETGLSQKVSGYFNQPANQVEIIASLAKVLRSGNYTGTVGKPGSAVLVGHSFGSFTSNIVIAKYPILVNGAVLTGIAYSPPEFNGKTLLEGIAPRIASQLSPLEFQELDTRYVTFADIFNHINTFFKAPAYEVAAAKYANSITQPFAIVEFLSLSIKPPVASNFGGLILITAGEFDFAVCGGESYSSFAQQPLKIIFSQSRMLEVFVQAGAGHEVDFATSATGFYNGITDFLGRAGF